MPLRTRIIVGLDQFLSWPPFVQIPLIVLLTVALVVLFACVYAAATTTSVAESLWFALTRFMDGGTMAADTGVARRAIAVGTTVAGVLIVSFLTGAFASKLGERIADLRSGRSPIIAENHILILGFDPKVPLIVRELARSSQRLSIVVLAKEEKLRMDALLRFATDIPGSRLHISCRTGDPTSEISLSRACADRARTIIIPAPMKLDDEHALRSVVSVLLSVRRAVGKRFDGRVVVESRRAVHAPLLELTGEAGLAGEVAVPIDVFASDDIVARVLAQSVREGGLYFALRELLSFQGAEFYLEPIPASLVGQSFEEAHGRIEHGIAVGVLLKDGTHRLAPPAGAHPSLSSTDRLIVLEESRGAFSTGGSLPEPEQPAPAQPIEPHGPRRILVLGYNRTLPRLVAELDRLLSKGSVVEICAPNTEGIDIECHQVDLVTKSIEIHHVEWSDPSIYEADAVVVLGCEEEEDPEADTSAISLLLRLRYAQRSSNRFVKRLITEVRDPILARQIANSPNDFLVSTDVVAMLLAQAAVDHRVGPLYREILDPTGVEVFLVPKGVYSTNAQASFGEIMAAARRRGEVAIGFFPDPSIGKAGDVEERNPIYLNPPRDARVPAGSDTSILVLADPPMSPR